MKRKLVCAAIILTLGVSAVAQVPLIKYDQLEKIIQQSDARLTVVNFWATWCGPCIKELPYFLEANKKPDVDVILVSLDFPQDARKVNDFVRKKELDVPVYHLDEKDYDSYMGKIDESWSGAIPATLLIDRKGERWFFERAFTRTSLFEEIEKRIN